MSIDGFITCLTLLVGLYTIANPVAKLRLKLLGWRLWLPSALFVGIVTYLLLFKYIGFFCHSDFCAPLTFAEDSRTPNDLAFVITLIWLGVLAVAYRARRFSIRSYSTFRNLVEELISDRRYGELAELISPHIDSLAQRATRSHWLQRALDKVRSHGTPKAEWAKLLEKSSEEKEEQPSRFGNVATKLISVGLYILKPIAALFPSEDRAEEHARLIIHRILTNEAFVRFVSQERSLLALKIMSLDPLNYYDFSDRSLTYMIEAPGGPLRQELWDNGNLDRGFFVIDPANPIIHFLFEDSHVAEKLEVYRPVGDVAVNCIDEDHNYRRFLNSKPRDLDKAKKHDNLFLVCHFFDIMIRSAVKDKIEWHMWLYYMNIIVERLVKVIDVSAPDYDENAEFPNYAHFIIYTIFRNLREWIDLFEYLPDGHVAAKIENVSATHENGHIIKSAILSIGICLHELVRSENVTDNYIAYILEIVLRGLRSARQHKHGALIAQALTNSILEGGPLGFKKAEGHRLVVCFHQMDHMAQFEHRDLGEELERRYA